MMDNKTIEKINAHYEHTKAKHPYFCDAVSYYTKDGITDLLATARNTLKISVKNQFVTPKDVLDCEVAEVFEAYHRGDIEQAIEEIHDCIAVLLRWKDVFEGRQALGKPVETKEEASARVWCKNDPTRKCVDCEGCPSTEGGAE